MGIKMRQGESRLSRQDAESQRSEQVQRQVCQQRSNPTRDGDARQQLIKLRPVDAPDQIGQEDDRDRYAGNADQQLTA